MKQVRHFIEGEFVESVDGATFDSISPIDNQPVAVVAEGGADDVDRAVRAAAAAFDPCAAMRPPPPTSTLAEICTGAGLPDGVFNVVNGFGPGSAGEALTRPPGVAAVTFTGESNTAKAIMA